MELYYSKEQKIEFLKKIGYIVEDMETWDTHTEYHNKVSTEYYQTKIAYKPGDDITEFGDNKYQVETNFGYERVFQRELQERLLKMLL